MLGAQAFEEGALVVLGLQNLHLCSALRAFKQVGMIVILSHLLDTNHSKYELLQELID
jgi:hypothetical protein